MPRGSNYTKFILNEKEKIISFLSQVSSEMYEYVKNSNSNFVLFYKLLTHSDLPTFGKATHVNSLEKNLLYYISEEDMRQIEISTKKDFETAHQSCIGLMNELYELMNIPLPRENLPYLLNDYMNVYLVNNNMKYFKSKYTKKVFDSLNKKVSNRSKSWDFDDLDVELTDSSFTPIDIHIAVHGLGMSQDTDFHKIRHHLFKGDGILLLYEQNGDQKNLFLIFDKNPLFFSLIGEVNTLYVKHQERIRTRLINQVTNKDNLIDNDDTEVTRQEQAAWRNMLAKEMMAYTQEPRQVFCPLTYITVDFDQLGTILVASHIKGFSDPNTTNDEKYDVNNGILICANADALFDKHLITINENKELVFSFLLDDIRLKSQLLLMQPIFKPILNDQRMKYLAYHREIFYKKESERRANTL